MRADIIVNAEDNDFEEQSCHLVADAYIQICDGIIEAIILLLAPFCNQQFNAYQAKEDGKDDEKSGIHLLIHYGKLGNSKFIVNDNDAKK